MKEINQMWQNAFRGELSNNLRRISNNFTRQLLMHHIITECVWYSTDMCLEYNRRGAFVGITKDTIENICYNVCYAMHGLVKEFNDNCWDEVYEKVFSLMGDPRTFSILQEEVNKYYQR